VVRSDGKILGEALAKQHDIHEEWGGVVPGLARDAHVAAIENVVETAIRNAGMQSVADVDAVAVTVGPGLEICLRVGCQKAIELATEYHKPFVGVHHLEAHILMARLPYHENSLALPEALLGTSAVNGDAAKKWTVVDFPFLALLVSGGHCQLLQCNGIGQYHILGGTLDDSLGEAYDKTARLLGLPVGGGGGPAVEEIAKLGDAKAIPMTVPMHARKDCDFSFAGLKTNVR
jgi:tRNA A37 threonylcarbamoyltransferase TsaD